METKFMNDPVHFICLRGLARESSHWGDFKAFWIKNLPEVQLHFIDLPGTGVYNHLASPLSIPEITDFLRKQFQTHCGSQIKKTYILALSLGGIVAWDWAQRYPDELNGLVLINTSLSRVCYPWQRLQPIAMVQLLTSFFTLSPLERQRRLLRLLSNDLSKLEGAAQLWVSIEQKRPLKLSTAVRQVFAAARFDPGEKAPDLPILILSSAKDRLVKSICSKKIATFWNLNLQIHDSAGHDLPIDDTPWILAQVKDWLQKVN
jgi:pimeloyl-ACP methyl ester carboxylesterase